MLTRRKLAATPAQRAVAAHRLARIDQATHFARAIQRATHEARAR
jgi:hypothetical protein